LFPREVTMGVKRTLKIYNGLPISTWDTNTVIV